MPRKGGQRRCRRSRSSRYAGGRHGAVPGRPGMLARALTGSAAPLPLAPTWRPARRG